MPPTRTATQIDVGPYDGRVGVRLHFDEGPAEVFLFDPTAAATLFHQGLAVVEALRQGSVSGGLTEEAPREPHPVSTAGVSDYAQVRLVK